MRYSKLFGRTRFDAPHDADSVNAKLLSQSGFVEKLAAGIYQFLPLGLRVLKKINQIIREEMDAVDGQEILMASLHPIEIWEQTGRDKTMGDILYRTTASGNKEFVLGPSHEETVTPLVKKNIQSYKDLPLSVYQLQTKFRDEPRAKSGLLRGREFGMKDMYSFHETEEDLDAYYDRVKTAYMNVYHRCGLDTYMIEASGGAFTDKISHEFSVKTSAGEDTMIFCPKCKIAQNMEIATGKIVDYDEAVEKEMPMKKVSAKRGASIQAGSNFHHVPAWKILKTVVYEVEGRGFAGICIRGDLNVNEHKVERYFQKRLRPASAEQLLKLGLVQGFISPVDNDLISFVADFSIQNVKNFCTGANEKDMDILNVNLGRDFAIKDFADFIEVKGGFLCGKCGSELSEEKAIEAGNIFKLGTKYSEAFDLKVQGRDGKLTTVIMGCYGIGNTRLLGTIVEACHDTNGIIWPKSVAPYLIYLISLGNDEKVKKTAEKLYEDFVQTSLEVLYDDRDESAGKKLKDADLIGIPLRIVVSSRTLEKDSVEWKERKRMKAEVVPVKELMERFNAWAG